MTVIHDNVPGGWWRVWTEAEGTLAYCATRGVASLVAKALEGAVRPSDLTQLIPGRRLVQLSKTGEEETP